MDDLERVKQQMEVQGSSMTDTAPLMKLKGAMQKLREETAAFEIRIGIVDNALLQAKIKKRHGSHI
jgi:estrogen-related receptor beta like 1